MWSSFEWMRVTTEAGHRSKLSESKSMKSIYDAEKETSDLTANRFIATLGGGN
jgi:hypothetical protein